MIKKITYVILIIGFTAIAKNQKLISQRESDPLINFHTSKKKSSKPQTNSYTDGVFIWSKSINNNSINWINTYLQYNNFSSVYISNGIDSLKRKTKKLIKSISKKNIQIEILIGIKKGKPGTIQDVIQSVTSGVKAKNIKAIHLDFEPHTANNFKQNKVAILYNYVQVLKKAKEYCAEHNWALHVDIPNFYPSSTLKDVYSIADQVFIMCYENVNKEFLKNRLREEITINLSKTNVSLSASDFSNRNELEELASWLRKEIGIKIIAIHDLRRLEKLDQVIPQGEKH